MIVLGTASGAAAQSLRGSRSSIDRQNREAQRHDFTFLREQEQVTKFAGAGLLVPVEGNRDYRLKGVSFEVARPEVRLFVERLSAQYHRACGMPLVVTSLTRPSASQPSNASARSVHPTGMALDLRRPADRTCRAWLESTLLHLEAAQVLDATLERNPPHYHVAIFPNRYIAYVAGRTGRAVEREVDGLPVENAHTVRPKETLWSISRQYNTTPLALRRANELDSNVIRTGQILRIP